MATRDRCSRWHVFAVFFLFQYRLDVCSSTSSELLNLCFLVHILSHVILTLTLKQNKNT